MREHWEPVSSTVTVQKVGRHTFVLCIISTSEREMEKTKAK